MLNRVLVVLVLCWAGLAQAQPGPIPLVDTHVHFESVPQMSFQASLSTALEEMDRRNIRMSLLMSPPRATFMSRINHDIEDLLFAAKAHPGRFAVLGGGGSLTIMVHETRPEAVDDATRQKFRQRAERIIALGGVGFGEMFIQHLSLPAMGPGHAYSNVPADHPLLLLLADIAAEHDVPIDMHFDMVPQDMPLPPALKSPPNPAVLLANREAFERLLAHNRKAKIVWSHVGFEPINTRSPQVVTEMLQAHPNLYMSFRLNRSGPRNTMALEPSGQLRAGWLALVQAFPDRFMLGSDVFYAPAGLSRGSSAEGMDNLRSLIEQLPPELALKVASENALRLYKLTPRLPAAH